ncbi:hypothetical protein pdam_00014373 [Pocillopora damicornis]|uniref:BACK domain-containing protein n=1 Tax=Pocillopora damicornis TaxID=46731 RepID=A0A3M6UF99_POCDA|nr:hypothetical protein pdam_00014373 [Pocillopora damicornis]
MATRKLSISSPDEDQQYSSRNVAVSIDGYDGDTQFNTSDSWITDSPLIPRRSALSTAVLRGKLYAVGGYVGGGFLNTLVVYFPKQNSWKLVSCMNLGRSGAGIAVGWKLKLESTSAAGFNSMFLETSDTWITVSPLIHRRSALSAAVLFEKLCVVRGYDGGGFLNTVEEYFREQDCRVLISSMNLGRNGAGFAVDWKPATGLKK